MGFVVEGKDWSEGEEEGEASFSAFVFESNTEGEKVTVDAGMWAGFVNWGVGLFKQYGRCGTRHDMTSYPKARSQGVDSFSITAQI